MQNTIKIEKHRKPYHKPVASRNSDIAAVADELEPHAGTRHRPITPVVEPPLAVARFVDVATFVDGGAIGGGAIERLADGDGDGARAEVARGNYTNRVVNSKQLKQSTRRKFCSKICEDRGELRTKRVINLK